MADKDNTQEEAKLGFTPKQGTLPRTGFLKDCVQVYNERTLKYELAWEHRFNKRHYVDFFLLTNAWETGPVSSKSFYCAPYRWASVLFDLKDTLSDPTRILILCWFSWDNVNWFQHMEDAWGRMQWEDTDMPSAEAYPIPILAPYIKFTYGITGGVEDTKYFPFKLSVVFNSTQGAERR